MNSTKIEFLRLFCFYGSSKYYVNNQECSMMRDEGRWVPFNHCWSKNFFMRLRRLVNWKEPCSLYLLFKRNASVKSTLTERSQSTLEFQQELGGSFKDEPTHTHPLKQRLLFILTREPSDHSINGNTCAQRMKTGRSGGTILANERAGTCVNTTHKYT